MIIQLPFPGFYNSYYSMGFEDDAEQFFEDQKEDGLKDNPFKLELTDWIEKEGWRYNTMTSEAMRGVCKLHVDQVADYFKRPDGLSIELTYESLSSPREYNFETDRLFCEISEADVQVLFDMSAADEHDHLGDLIKERCTSRDGFCSSYPNGLDSWLERPVNEWDHNELGILIEAIGNIDFIDNDFANEIERDVYEYASGNGEFGAIEYERFYTDLRLEQDRLEMESGMLWHELPIRCPHTSNLFT